MNLRKYYILFILPFFLNACSTVVFPDIVEEDEVVTKQAEDKAGKKVIEEGNSLPSDEQNAAYEDEGKGEKVAEAKTVPVYKGTPEGYREPKKTGVVAVEKEFDSKDNIKVTDAKYVETKVEDMVKKPAPEDKNFEPSVTYRVATVYFENGQSGVSPEYYKDIKNIVKQAKTNKARIYIYGFSSSRTKNMDIASHKLANFKVSLERAESVAKELKRAGLSSKVIFVEAMSDTNPAYLEVMPEGERLNRRAEVYISY